MSIIIDVELYIAENTEREKGAERCMDKRVLRSSHASKTWETRGERSIFQRLEPLERSPLSRLPSCHPSRMRMSAAAMIRPLHLSYRTRSNVLSRPAPFPFPPLSPPRASLRRSDLSLETKSERVPASTSL